MRRIEMLLITAISFLACTIGYGQSAPQNWHLLDLKEDGYPGVSLEKAYRQLLKDRKPEKPVVIAVIDDGVNIEHPLLKSYIRTNSKEIPGNGKDDDGNGYVDDVNGWSFCGCTVDAREIVREYVRLRPVYESNPDIARIKNKKEYIYWREIVKSKDEYFSQFVTNPYQTEIDSLQALQDYWQTQLNTTAISYLTLKDKNTDTTASEMVKRYHRYFVTSSTENDSTTLLGYIGQLKAIKFPEKTSVYFASAELLQQQDPYYFRHKNVPGDDPGKNQSAYYGNPLVFCEQSAHGNWVAACIKTLIDAVPGSSEYIKILPVQVFPFWRSDVYEKDIANAIRYAVDNGADVINMSFIMDSLAHPDWLFDAIKYAQKKGVLLVRGAGNNGKEIAYYPNQHIGKRKTVDNFLVVAGSTTNEKGLVWSGSTYGKDIVDLFAPADEFSVARTVDEHAIIHGTSYAGPVVSVLAAIIRSYYPGLDYKQVQYCLEQSAAPIEKIVMKPKTNEEVPFCNLSRTGGIVNAFTALQEAEKIASKQR